LYSADRSTQKIGHSRASGIMPAVRALTVLCLVAAATARAQTDAGTAKPKGALVILGPAPAMSKAVGSAKEDEAPPPAAVNDADVGLLRALLWAFEPAPTEIRVIAIEDLGLLGDPRGLNPLAQLVMDPNPAVSLAALRAIGSIQHPRAEAILCNIVRHPQIAERIKLAAIDALVFQNSWLSIAFLKQVATTNFFHPAITQRARTVLLDIPSGSTR
jgi:hypothetical protein